MARDGINGANDRSRRGMIYGGCVEQRPPGGDNRARVNASARFYIAVVECGAVGCTLYINEGAERVKSRENGKTVVRLDNEKAVLRRAETLRPFVDQFLKGGLGVYVGSVSI